MGSLLKKYNDDSMHCNNYRGIAYCVTLVSIESAFIYMLTLTNDDYAHDFYELENIKSKRGSSNPIITQIYILLNFVVIIFQFLNFLESFQTDTQKNIYEQDFQKSVKKIGYPCQIFLRCFFVLFGWRIYQYSKLRDLYPEQFNNGQLTSSYYSDSERSSH